MGDSLVGMKKPPMRTGTHQIVYKGVFVFKNFYQFLHDWIQEEGFKDDNGVEKDLWETFYWERRSAAGFTDYNIWWRMKASPPSQSTQWYEYRLNIDFMGIAIAKTEVMHEGKKVGAHNGELNVFITPQVVFDPNNLWKKGTWFDSFSDVFMNRIYRKEFKMHKDQLADITFRLQEAIKDFLGLTTFTDSGETFHPTRGLGWG